MVDEEEADEVFQMLDDPIRIEIRRTFAAVTDELEAAPDGAMPELSFSELYERVDVLSFGLRYVSEKLGDHEWTTERVASDSAEYEVIYRTGGTRFDWWSTGR